MKMRTLWKSATFEDQCKELKRIERLEARELKGAREMIELRERWLAEAKAVRVAHTEWSAIQPRP